jgi:hypothetical protein
MMFGINAKVETGMEFASIYRISEFESALPLES